MSDFDPEWKDKMSSAAFAVDDWTEAANVLNVGKVEGRYADGIRAAMADIHCLLHELEKCQQAHGGS